MACRTKYITYRLTANEVRALLSLQPPPRLREYLRDSLNAATRDPVAVPSADFDAPPCESQHITHRDAKREWH